uniref:alpha-amylase n=1 Tax=Tetraselmis chuii TaxID=63592 RepID=A0A7S1T2P7_9CHLO|mmetsp:Transcript_42566/g.76324  ORF Transcript_42566/g.76324 Transcript_42566/m.76324 type:complete len:589 (+) Transcript_42566:1023-2789(+)|eukprot:CAMPEP_0177789292 /NCGR_PEP_ID=MMETSP0491_2-20121128/22661_1 /TAXON_ID=63592 /ORGANISM="Tetraselmis chuii, Strain PLY429" /LENGTH=588 /DNA_ID=CAMNT_0019311125 /DNA_START=759 /DNA_END=2525 /DNA_ORIENTATION=-
MAVVPGPLPQNSRSSLPTSHRPTLRSGVRCSATEPRWNSQHQDQGQHPLPGSPQRGLLGSVGLPSFLNGGARRPQQQLNLVSHKLIAENVSELANLAKVQAETSRAAEATMPKISVAMAALQAELAKHRDAAASSELGKPMAVPLRVPVFDIPDPSGTSRRRPGAAGVGPDGTGEEILLQGFNWESHKHDWYAVLSGQAADIAEAGFTLVWMPPPTDSVSPEGYLPRDLYSLNSNYGSLDSLRSCIKALQGHGIKVLGDAVLNHRCAHFQDSNGVWNKFGGKMDWDARAIVSDDPHFHGKGHVSTGDAFHAAPNIDHSQEFVRADISEWLQWLRQDIGFDGWRLDYVRGFHGRFVGEYMESSAPFFAVGEYWDSLAYDSAGVPEHNQNGHRQRIVNWINAAGGKATAFDVTTKGILHAVFQRNEYWRLRDHDGKPPGVMGWWPSRATTFLENHDTGSTQGHWRFPENGLEQGYAYILTHPGTPTVFYDHFFQDGLQGTLKELMALRKRNRLSSRSSIHIHHADKDVYAAEVDERLVLKLGPGDWSPNHNLKAASAAKGKWVRVAQGRDWCAWEAESPPSLTTPHHHHK